MLFLKDIAFVYKNFLLLCVLGSPVISSRGEERGEDEHRVEGRDRGGGL